MSGRFGRGWCGLSGALVLLACGSRSDVADSLGGGDSAVYPWQAGAAATGLRLPRSCVEDWRVLYEGEGYGHGELAVADGEVIFSAASAGVAQAELRALDLASSGSYRVLRAAGVYAELWLEGSDILLWTGERLIRVPLQGGPEEVLLDLGGSAAAAASASLLVTEDAFYWALPRNAPGQLDIWQQKPRAGSPSRLASLSLGELYAPELAVSQDTLLVAGYETSVAVPLAGGAARPLAAVPDGELAGVDRRGAYYLRVANRTRRGGQALERELLRAGADGSAPSRFWRGSAGERLDRVWPIESGWLATGAYYKFDGRPHAVLAYIDESGDETLIACDRADNQLQGRVVFWQRAFYAITVAGNRSRVVEIPLPE